MTNQTVLLCYSSVLNILQVICKLPAKVPAERAPAVALALHEINGTLRLGQFSLNAWERTVLFRLGLVLHPEGDLAHQIGATVATAFATMSRHFPGLLLLVCASKAAREQTEAWSGKSKRKRSRAFPRWTRRPDLN